MGLYLMFASFDVVPKIINREKYAIAQANAINR